SGSRTRASAPHLGPPQSAHFVFAERRCLDGSQVGCGRLVRTLVFAEHRCLDGSQVGCGRLVRTLVFAEHRCLDGTEVGCGRLVRTSCIRRAPLPRRQRLADEGVRAPPRSLPVRTFAFAEHRCLDGSQVGCGRLVRTSCIPREPLPRRQRLADEGVRAPLRSLPVRTFVFAQNRCLDGSQVGCGRLVRTLAFAENRCLDGSGSRTRASAPHFVPSESALLHSQGTAASTAAARGRGRPRPTSALPSPHILYLQSAGASTAPKWGADVSSALLYLQSTAASTVPKWGADASSALLYLQSTAASTALKWGADVSSALLVSAGHR